jgi:hypothetical protein
VYNVNLAAYVSENSINVPGKIAERLRSMVTPSTMTYIEEKYPFIVNLDATEQEEVQFGETVLTEATQYIKHASVLQEFFNNN